MQLNRLTSTDIPESLARVAPRVDFEPGPPLIPRELEVAALIGRGLSNRMIAEELSISIATVERHAANIFNKLGVRARASVAVWAAENDLLSSRRGQAPRHPKASSEKYTYPYMVSAMEDAARRRRLNAGEDASTRLRPVTSMS